MIKARHLVLAALGTVLVMAAGYAVYVSVLPSEDTLEFIERFYGVRLPRDATVLKDESHESVIPTGGFQLQVIDLPADDSLLDWDPCDPIADGWELTNVGATTPGQYIETDRFYCAVRNDRDGFGQVIVRQERRLVFLAAW